MSTLIASLGCGGGAVYFAIVLAGHRDCVMGDLVMWIKDLWVCVCAAVRSLNNCLGRFVVGTCSVKWTGKWPALVEKKSHAKVIVELAKYGGLPFLR